MSLTAADWTDDQRLLHDWTLTHLRLLRSGGRLVCPDPAPLSTEQITSVLDAIAEADVYQQQTVSVPDRDGRRSVLRWADGRALVEAAISQDEDHEQILPYGATVCIREPATKGTAA